MPKPVLWRQHTFQIQIILTGLCWSCSRLCQSCWIRIRPCSFIIVKCLSKYFTLLKTIRQICGYFRSTYLETDNKVKLLHVIWALVTLLMFLACHKYTVPQWNRLFLYLVYPHDNELRSYRESYKHQVRHDNPWLVNTAFEPIGFWESLLLLYW